MSSPHTFYAVPSLNNGDSWSSGANVGVQGYKATFTCTNGVIEGTEEGCESGATWNASIQRCERDSNCVGTFPANAVNTSSNGQNTYKSSYYQGKWRPVGGVSWGYNETPGECTFKCNTNYTWSQNTCMSATRTNQSCTGLPAHAEWNSVSSIVQTWNGSDWMPTLGGAYNITPTSTECRYKCATNYTWNGSSCALNLTGPYVLKVR